MGESEEAKLRAAEQLWRSRNIIGAVAMYFELLEHGKDPQARLTAAMVLLDRLKFPQAPEKLLPACTVGIECAKQVSDAKTQARFMAKKAEYLVTFNGMRLVPVRKRLRMPPGWFAFTLEREKRQHEELTRQMDANEAEADGLIAAAVAICEEIGDRSTKGHVLICAGTMAFQRYVSRKIDDLPSQIRIRGRLMRWLSEHRLDEYLLYDAKCRSEMRKLVKRCEASFLEAADLFRDVGEEDTVAYAFYNLANNLRSAYRFRKAARYLQRARAIAEEFGNQALLSSIRTLGRSITLKNRDTPNYAAGEQRPEERAE